MQIKYANHLLPFLQLFMENMAVVNSTQNNWKHDKQFLEFENSKELFTVFSHSPEKEHCPEAGKKWEVS